MKIMFVCTGNTCRSPLAHAFMLDLLGKMNMRNVEVDSAGIGCNFGDPISTNSQEVLKENGIEFEHTSKPISLEDIKESDYIICMTKSHKMMLSAFAPKEKLFCIDDITHDGDVIDPYGRDLDTYRKTGEQIKNAVEKIALFIQNNKE